MKIILTLLAFLITSLLSIAYAQTGYYRNLFGDNYTNINTKPRLMSLDPISGGRHFAGSSERTYADYFTCVLYNNDFSPIWTASYEATLGGPTNYISNGIELDNGTIVSHGMYDGTRLFIGHDANGNLLFSRYYGTLGDDYSSSAMVESSENDTCFVALFAQCAVHHGLTKFDKNGNVLWSFENALNGIYNAYVYTLDNAINGGYISGGINTVAMPDTSQYYGYLIVSNNDGTFNKGMKYEHTSNDYNRVLIRRILTAQNGTYYVNFKFSNDYSGPFENGRNSTIAQLDSNLNILHEWEFSVSDTNQSVNIDKLAETSDGKLLLSGSIYDDVNNPDDQYFLLKFDPNVMGGQIEWCKKFELFYNPQSWSSTTYANALYASELDDQIIFAYNAGSDGSCVSSVDQNGEGHCQSSDKMINHSEVSDINAFDYTNIALVEPMQHFDVPLTPFSADLKDTVYCAMNSVGLNENNAPVDILEVSQTAKGHVFRNVSNSSLEFVVYSMQGEVFLQKELQVGEMWNVEFPSNRIYIFNAYSSEGNQIGRVITL